MPDGGRKIFTVLREPFIVNKAWLIEQTKLPEVGDFIEVTDAEALTLVTEHKAAADAIDEEPTETGSQKKSIGSAEHGESSLAEFSKYQGKPVIVHASEITAVGTLTSDGCLEVTLAGGAVREATPEMLARMTPIAGDCTARWWQL